MKPYLCFEYKEGSWPIRLYQDGFDKFTVEYGSQASVNLNYANAAAELGSSIMHFLSSEGKIDNRLEEEAKENGDVEPYFG